LGRSAAATSAAAAPVLAPKYPIRSGRVSGCRNEPIGDSNQPLGEQADIEAQLRRLQIDCLLLRAQQIDQQCRKLFLI
jgi:hypothetical protein